MNGWTLVLELISFLLLVVILQRLLFRPIQDVMRTRQQRLEEQARAAVTERDAAERLRNELAGALATQAEQRRQVLASARAEADAERLALRAQAQREAESLLERARRDLEYERLQLGHALVEQLERDVLERLTARIGAWAATVDAAGVALLLERLEQLPVAELEQANTLIASGRRPLLLTARPLVAGQAAVIAEVLMQRLGAVQPLEFEQVLDTRLVAGIELELGHLRLIASWRDVITRATASWRPSDV
jgi:F-type H+-transporting ATPase subunit b